MSDKIIHIITGGQRSGKSEYGEEIALSLDDKPTYLATSKCWDDEFRKRIEIHKNRRTSNWTTIEETLHLSQTTTVNKVLFIDCITLWLTNVMDYFKYDPDLSFDFVVKEWNVLCEKNNIVIAITNEIGLGVIPMEKATRKFVDLQGKVNQYIAKKATKVDFMVSGIPIHTKG
ncbi:bifunctional adenosylcobinamide kinase/adenosylcobinamide-phosphate guanylyltransferase [Formosa sediminum]|uniref:Adenosylcobinamide kinase n=1 Tax=Formosa sediminum TaxID=2594004 RepID=A0A516GSC6_9FLAO|nr:bifunctional adenosylcobinamide kinase/adenosylcobinamide-phosphate guanylyltransferase [Formosa sediminum]QDO94421.1 bifunctional adenosylcobinamide kinase/adenosylcobinamide-phosphate guanylyltransferase [Formosa sediminum]